MRIRQNYWHYLLLFFLVAAAYTNSLGNSFVTDDVVSIVGSYPRPFLSIFSEHYYVFRHVLYFLTYQVAGLNPIIFRLTNIAFHLGTVWLAYGIVALLECPLAALVAASLFAVHPIAVESVAWISGGVYPQYAFFFLLSFFLYLKAAKQTTLLFFSYVSFFLCLLSSEKAVALFLVFFLYEWLWGNLKGHLTHLLFFPLIATGFLLYYLSFFSYRSGFVVSSTGRTDGLYNPLVQLPIAITTYLRFFFWPDALSYYHSQRVFSAPDFAIRLAGVLGFLGLVLGSFRRHKRIFFWFVFFLIALSPTLTPLKLGSLVAERYGYLAMVGLSVVVAIAFSWLQKKIPFPAVHLILLILLLLLLGRTITRNVDWRDEEHLWFATIKTAPQSANAHDNLGVVYLWRHDYATAKKEFELAAKLNPGLGEAYFHLGFLAQRDNNLDQALSLYTHAIELNPTIWPAYQNLATIYLEKNELDLATAAIDKALSLNPKNSNLILIQELIQKAAKGK